MMQAYVNTGDFTIAKRLKSAVKVNLRFYSIYVVVGTIGLIYLIFGSGLTTRYTTKKIIGYCSFFNRTKIEKEFKVMSWQQQIVGVYF